MSAKLTVNKKHVKLFVLAVAQKRSHRFSRVSAEFYARADMALKNWMINYVAQLPSKGKTIK